MGGEKERKERVERDREGRDDMLRHREKKRERERNENRVKVTTLYIDLLCSLSPIHTESIN